MIGPSTLPMPPMITMKMTSADQSVTLNAAAGVMRSFSRTTRHPTNPAISAAMR